MATLPPFSFSAGYFLFILSVTLTSLGLVAVGGMIKSVFKRKTFPTFRKKIIIFPLFIIGIFVMGWLTAKLQQLVLVYLEKNVATSITGLLIALTVTWFLYDWAVWRKS